MHIYNKYPKTLGDCFKIAAVNSSLAIASGIGFGTDRNLIGAGFLAVIFARSFIAMRENQKKPEPSIEP